MTFSLKNSFTGGTTGLSNGYSYGNNIQGQRGIGQRANGVSDNDSSPYKTVKLMDESEPKKYPMCFLFGNREITFYTPYSLWMPEEKFQQMQREKERSKQFSASQKTAIQGDSRIGDGYNRIHSKINRATADSLVSWRAGQTPIQRNQREDSVLKMAWLKEPADGKQANTGRLLMQGIGEDTLLLGNDNQNSFGFSAHILNNDRQSIGRLTSDRTVVNLAAGGNTDDSIQEIPKIGYNPASWYHKGDLGTGELITMPEFFQTVDDVVRYYGGWSEVENEIPGEMRSDFSAACTFLSTWGLEYANFLVSKAPVPLNVKAAITAGLFLIGVCKALKEVKTKRDTMIKDLTAGRMSPQLAEAEANKMVDGWLLEEIGKIAIETVIGTTMNQIGLKPYQQSTIVAAWDAFVDKVESGI